MGVNRRPRLFTGVIQILCYRVISLAAFSGPGRMRSRDYSIGVVLRRYGVHYAAEKVCNIICIPFASDLHIIFNEPYFRIPAPGPAAPRRRPTRLITQKIAARFCFTPTKNPRGRALASFSTVLGSSINVFVLVSVV